MAATLAPLTAFREQALTGASDTSSDSFFTACLERATGIIEACVGRKLTQSTWTEYLDGDGSSFLNLRQGPIESLGTVCEVTYAANGAESTSAVAAGDYFVRGLASTGWRLPGHIQANGWKWTTGIRNYQVTYTSGYSVSSTSSSAPQDLQETCLHVAMWLRNKRADVANYTRDVGGGVLGGFRLDDDLYRELQYRLAPYIDRRFA